MFSATIRTYKLMTCIAGHSCYFVDVKVIHNTVYF